MATRGRHHERSICRGVGIVGIVGGMIAIVIVGAVAYAAIRGRAMGDPGRAFANGRSLLAVEEAIGLAVERGVQDWFVRHGAAGLVSAVYAIGYWPVVAVAVAWTAWRDRMLAARLGMAFGISGLFGLVVFGLFPVAPPRMLPGFVDTVGNDAGLASVAHPQAIANPYAAMPSFHVGWLVLAAIAIRAAGGHGLLRAAALVPPAVMTVAVVATANHYVLDVMAGAALVAVAWRLGGPCLACLIRAIERQPQASPWPPRRATGDRGRILGDRVLDTVGGRS